MNRLLGIPHLIFYVRVFKITMNYSLVAQMVKHLPAMRETWVRSLGWEDLLEKEMATHSSTLAWRIPRTEEPGRLQSMGSQRVGHDERLQFPFTVYIMASTREHEAFEFFSNIFNFECFSN